MEIAGRCTLFAALLLATAVSDAQIYTCIAEDGSRVFSDQRCGPDAKVVPGIDTPSRTTPPAGSSRPARTRKSPAELAQLTERCDAGDMKACSAWTLGGGPALLRELERKTELECEGGSLRACEERYCRDGVDEDCRARVQRTAQLAGESWYLRSEESAGEGRIRYSIRCLRQDVGEHQDASIICSSAAGPSRCAAADMQLGYPRLAAAATAHCERAGGAESR